MCTVHMYVCLQVLHCHLLNPLQVSDYFYQCQIERLSIYIQQGPLATAITLAQNIVDQCKQCSTRTSKFNPNSQCHTTQIPILWLNIEHSINVFDIVKLVNFLPKTDNGHIFMVVGKTCGCKLL